MKEKPFDKLTVNLFDDGDRSVGIEPTRVTITFECNAEFREQIDYHGNRELFREQVKKLGEWFTDMPVTVLLEDECYDCGQKVTDRKEHLTGCPVVRFEKEMDEVTEKVRRK